LVPEAIGQSLPFAVGAAVSPIPIVAMVLLLTTPRATGNGLAFLGGWLGGLIGVGALVITLAGGSEVGDRGEPAGWVAALMLVVAGGLFWLGLRSWSKRPRPDQPPETPGWMDAIAGFGPPRSAGLGLASAANPKNLLLTVSGALEIAAADTQASDELGALLVFAALCSLGVLTPLFLRLTRGEGSAGTLDRLKRWLERNNSTVMAVVLVLLAANLAGDALKALAA
jgi:hypothetical protein